jgi:hypothetical protein
MIRKNFFLNFQKIDFLFFLFFPFGITSLATKEIYNNLFVKILNMIFKKKRNYYFKKGCF